MHTFNLSDRPPAASFNVQSDNKSRFETSCAAFHKETGLLKESDYKLLTLIKILSHYIVQQIIRSKV